MATIEEISKKIAKKFDDDVAKAFVLSVWKLLKDNGINVCLSSKEVDCIINKHENHTTYERTYELNFTDIDTSEHDANVIEDAIDKIKWHFENVASIENRKGFTVEEIAIYLEQLKEFEKKTDGNGR